jgi:hypothetical protein
MRMAGPASFGVASTGIGLDATFAARPPGAGMAGLALRSTGGIGFVLEEIMRGVDYRRFQDVPRWTGLFVGRAAALMFQQGIYEGQFVKGWLGERLGRLGVHTFADLPYDDPQRPPDPERAWLGLGCLQAHVPEQPATGYERCHASPRALRSLRHSLHRRARNGDRVAPNGPICALPLGHPQRMDGLSAGR